MGFTEVWKLTQRDLKQLLIKQLNVHSWKEWVDVLEKAMELDYNPFHVSNFLTLCWVLQLTQKAFMDG